MAYFGGYELGKWLLSGGVCQSRVEIFVEVKLSGRCLLGLAQLVTLVMRMKWGW